MIDAHCHIQFQAYNDDRDAVIARSKVAGVKMIAVGTKQSTSENAVRLAHENPDCVWATVGFHPTHVNKFTYYHDKNEEGTEAPEEFDIQKLGALAKAERVVAIGECGLDYFRIDGDRASIIAKQKEAFDAQIKLAQQLQKPLMLHCRASKGVDDAYEDLLDVLQSSDFRHSSVLHFYAGSLAMTKKFVDAGYYFTFGGVITFGADYDEIVKYIPMDHIMLETDAPYVAPMPYRGKRNEPHYIIETAKKLAFLKNEPVEKILEMTASTATKIFNLHK